MLAARRAAPELPSRTSSCKFEQPLRTMAKGHIAGSDPLLESVASERWMSGLSRTPGKRVRVNSPPRVRIPPAPPKTRDASLAS
ncbi:hypothetical protein VARIO8X_90141 [Burkholderiales bacterium 8X]|nr:hypothetical protein VARIO8X_90141 [Burkholderiales bacterium 8X]